jgi:hypothetical protein
MKGEKLGCLSLHLELLSLFASIRVHSRLRLCDSCQFAVAFGLLFLCLRYGYIDYGEMYCLPS